MVRAVRRIRGTVLTAAMAAMAAVREQAITDHADRM